MYVVYTDFTTFLWQQFVLLVLEPEEQSGVASLENNVCVLLLHSYSQGLIEHFVHIKDRVEKVESIYKADFSLWQWPF